MTGSSPPAPARRGTDRAIAVGFTGMWVIGLAAALRFFQSGQTALGALAGVGALLVFVAAVQMVLQLRRQWMRSDGGAAMRRRARIGRPPDASA